MQTIPSSFDICCFVFAKINKRILLINKIPQSMIDSFSTCSGERMAENPRINKMLNRLEPIAFPSARPLSPFLVATMEVTSSGREDPIATTEDDCGEAGNHVNNTSWQRKNFFRFVFRFIFDCVTDHNGNI